MFCIVYNVHIVPLTNGRKYQVACYVYSATANMQGHFVDHLSILHSANKIIIILNSP